MQGQALEVKALFVKLFREPEESYQGLEETVRKAVDSKKISTVNTVLETFNDICTGHSEIREDEAKEALEKIIGLGFLEMISIICLPVSLEISKTITALTETLSIACDNSTLGISKVSIFLPYLLRDVAGNSVHTVHARLNSVKFLNRCFGESVESLLQQIETMKHQRTIHDEMGQIISTAGDFELQAAMLELVFRLIPEPERKNYVQLWFVKKDVQDAFCAIADDSFEGGCREFLNKLNESMENKRSVYSFPCLNVQVGDKQIRLAKDEALDNFWVDFNLVSRTIKFFIEEEEEGNSEESDVLWDTVAIKPEDIWDHRLEPTPHRLLLRLKFKNPNYKLAASLQPCGQRTVNISFPLSCDVQIFRQLLDKMNVAPPIVGATPYTPSPKSSICINTIHVGNRQTGSMRLLPTVTAKPPAILMEGDREIEQDSEVGTTSPSTHKRGTRTDVEGSKESEDMIPCTPDDSQMVSSKDSVPSVGASQPSGNSPAVHVGNPTGVEIAVTADDDTPSAKSTQDNQKSSEKTDDLDRDGEETHPREDLADAPESDIMSGKEEPEQKRTERSKEGRGTDSSSSLSSEPRQKRRTFKTKSPLPVVIVQKRQGKSSSEEEMEKEVHKKNPKKKYPSAFGVDKRMEKKQQQAEQASQSMTDIKKKVFGKKGTSFPKKSLLTPSRALDPRSGLHKERDLKTVPVPSYKLRHLSEPKFSSTSDIESGEEHENEEDVEVIQDSLPIDSPEDTDRPRRRSSDSVLHGKKTQDNNRLVQSDTEVTKIRQKTDRRTKTSPKLKGLFKRVQKSRPTTRSSLPKIGTGLYPEASSSSGTDWPGPDKDPGPVSPLDMIPKSLTPAKPTRGRGNSKRTSSGRGRGKRTSISPGLNAIQEENTPESTKGKSPHVPTQSKASIRNDASYIDTHNENRTDDVPDEDYEIPAPDFDDSNRCSPVTIDASVTASRSTSKLRTSRNQKAKDAKNSKQGNVVIKDDFQSDSGKSNGSSNEGKKKGVPQRKSRKRTRQTQEEDKRSEWNEEERNESRGTSQSKRGQRSRRSTRHMTSSNDDYSNDEEDNRILPVNPKEKKKAVPRQEPDLKRHHSRNSLNVTEEAEDVASSKDNIPSNDENEGYISDEPKQKKRTSHPDAQSASSVDKGKGNSSVFRETESRANDEDNQKRKSSAKLETQKKRRNPSKSVKEAENEEDRPGESDFEDKRMEKKKTSPQREGQRKRRSVDKSDLADNKGKRNKVTLNDSEGSGEDDLAKKRQPQKGKASKRSQDVGDATERRKNGDREMMTDDEDEGALSGLGKGYNEGYKIGYDHHNDDGWNSDLSQNVHENSTHNFQVSDINLVHSQDGSSQVKITTLPSKRRKKVTASSGISEKSHTRETGKRSLRQDVGNLEDEEENYNENDDIDADLYGDDQRMTGRTKIKQSVKPVIATRKKKASLSRVEHQNEETPEMVQLRQLCQNIAAANSLTPAVKTPSSKQQQSKTPTSITNAKKSRKRPSRGEEEKQDHRPPESILSDEGEEEPNHKQSRRSRACPSSSTPYSSVQGKIFGERLTMSERFGRIQDVPSSSKSPFLPTTRMDDSGIGITPGSSDTSRRSCTLLNSREGRASKATPRDRGRRMGELQVTTFSMTPVTPRTSAIMKRIDDEDIDEDHPNANNDIGQVKNRFFDWSSSGPSRKDDHQPDHEGNNSEEEPIEEVEQEKQTKHSHNPNVKPRRLFPNDGTGFRRVQEDDEPGYESGAEEDDSSREMSSMINVLGSSLVKSMRRKRLSMQKFSDLTMEKTMDMMNQYWKRDQLRRDKLVKSFRQEFRTEVASLENAINEHQKTEEQFLARLEQHAKMLSTQRIIQENKIKGLQELCVGFEQQIGQDSQPSTQIPFTEKLRGEVSQMQKRFILDMQKQDRANLRRSLESILETTVM